MLSKLDALFSQGSNQQSSCFKSWPSFTEQAWFDESPLQDFVKLAKWEDRGQYAQKQETEKAQRQLHKLVRDAQGVLAQPAAAALESVPVGFSELPNQVGGGSEAPEDKQRKSRKAAADKALAEPVLVWGDQVLHFNLNFHCSTH